MRYLIYIFLLLFSVSQAQQLAFPTATGAGAYTTGGRGGQVIHVTTLDFGAVGGLKAALETTGPRTIVFDVSGVIDVTPYEGYYELGRYNDALDDLTIAGQTSPGGITILHEGFGLDISNIIIRGITFMVDGNPTGPVTTPDALFMYNSSDIIIDHCAFYYGNDEGVDITNDGGGRVNNVTFQRNIVGRCKTGMLIGSQHIYSETTYGTSNATIAYNLFTSTSHRFPNPKEAFSGQMDIINNVVYNWKERLARNEGYYDSYTRTTETQKINYIGNYNKMATVKPWHVGMLNKHWVYTQNLGGAIQMYTANNIITGYQDTPVLDDQNLWKRFFVNDGETLPTAYFTQTQHTLNGESFTIQSAANAYTDVINDVGASKYLNADGTTTASASTVRATMLDEVINDNATVFGGRNSLVYPTITQVNRPAGYDTDLDGMPDVWETATFGDLTKDGTADTNADGYSDLERFINSVDGAVVPPVGTPPILTPSQKIKSKRSIIRLIRY